MHTCEWPSPMLNFVDHIQFPHCCGQSPTVADTYTSVIIVDICNQLQSFDMQSCCMMSTYHITKYNQLIGTFFKLCNNVSPTIADRATIESILWDLILRSRVQTILSSVCYIGR